MTPPDLSLEKILKIILVFTATVLAVSTVLVFATKRASPGKNLRKSDPNPEKIEKSAADKEKLSSFTGIERLRAVTSPSENHMNGVSLVVTPWFSYTADDSEFFEELSRKSSRIKSTISMYFSRHTYEELKNMGENQIKKELLSEINAQLSLNKVQGLYFSEYLFLE